MKAAERSTVKKSFLLYAALHYFQITNQERKLFRWERLKGETAFFL